MEEVLHIVVQGRVQGVGFRYHIQSAAARLGLAGWVRNLPSGEVEILVRASSKGKEEFLQAVRRGPAMSRVEALRVRPAPQAMACPEEGFTVRG